MVALDDVKDGDRVTAGKQSLYDVSAEETAATDDEERVAKHGTMSVGYDERNGLTLSFPFPAAITCTSTFNSKSNGFELRNVHSRAETPTSRKLGHRRYLSLFSFLSPILFGPQSLTALANSNHGSQTLSQPSATATNAS
jgi:hypothetical protein